MFYSKFKLNEVFEAFGLTPNQKSGLFADIPEESLSELLTTILLENVDLAV